MQAARGGRRPGVCRHYDFIAGTAFAVGESGDTARLTVSIGVATYPEMARDMDDLVAHADAALYAAKRTGKDLVQVYRR